MGAEMDRYRRHFRSEYAGSGSEIKNSSSAAGATQHAWSPSEDSEQQYFDAEMDRYRRHYQSEYAGGSASGSSSAADGVAQNASNPAEDSEQRYFDVEMDSYRKHFTKEFVPKNEQKHVPGLSNTSESDVMLVENQHSL